MVKVAATILTNKKEELIRLLNNAKYADITQIDVMDGKFVPTKSIWLKDIKKIKTKNKREFHLMIKNPERYINHFIKIKPYSIIIHYESTKKLNLLIKKIKNKKIKFGLAINPETKISKIKPFLHKADFITLLMVHPGYYGAKFLKSQLKKIKQLRKITKLPIEVDGGINPGTGKLCVKAGATILASGSFIQKSKNPREAIKKLKSKG